MISKRETPEAIEERGTGSTKYARLSNRAMGKRRTVEVLIAVLIGLMLNIYLFYLGKWTLEEPIWGGFWFFTICIWVWVVVAIVRVFRRPNHETDKCNPSVPRNR
jgi:hypothetical protein